MTWMNRLQLKITCSLFILSHAFFCSSMQPFFFLKKQKPKTSMHPVPWVSFKQWQYFNEWKGLVNGSFPPSSSYFAVLMPLQLFINCKCTTMPSTECHIACFTSRKKKQREKRSNENCFAVATSTDKYSMWVCPSIINAISIAPSLHQAPTQNVIKLSRMVRLIHKFELFIMCKLKFWFVIDWSFT